MAEFTAEKIRQNGVEAVARLTRRNETTISGSDSLPHRQEKNFSVRRSTKSGQRKVTRSDKTTGLRCVLCERVIHGEPRVMTLQITSRETRFTEKARELGFTSNGWQQGESMKGYLHKNCFYRAAMLWKIAFETRPVSPRP